MSEYRVCPHCNETVSSKVFKAHERLYYNKEERKWITLADLEIQMADDISNDSDQLPELSPPSLPSSGM